MGVLKRNSGYILLESLISLVILVIIVTSYLEVTIQMQQDCQRRLASLTNYRDLYTEVRRKRLHGIESTKSQIEISFKVGKAFNHQGGILIVKQ